MKNIKLIIFDWDDVITIGSKEGYFACYHETLVELGINMGMREEQKIILAKWGQSDREVLKALLDEEPGLLNQAFEIYNTKLFGNVFTSKLSICPGLPDILKRLAKTYKLAVATGTNTKFLKERIMPEFGIDNVFSKIVSAADLDDPTKAKPSPFMVEEIIKDLNVTARDTIMLGDASVDIIMAKAAGITPVAVLTGYLNEAKARELGVKYVIKDVTKLETILDDIA